MYQLERQKIKRLNLLEFFLWRNSLSRIIENPRELILNEARKILNNEGYKSISIRRVAKECDIAVGTIYNYFPTKKDLIVEMMTSFWNDCIYCVNNIVNSNEDFYTKLENIYNNLSDFIKRFKEIWLNEDLYSSPDYIESGLERQNIYINKLISIIEDLLKEKATLTEYRDIKKIDTQKIASFIVMNFISMIQMPYLEYAFFESLLKKII